MVIESKIDELIRARAKLYAEHIADAALKATKEEEIRIASERELAFIEQAAGCPTHSRVSNEWDREAEYVSLSGHS